jgi:hypothetical protein
VGTKNRDIWLKGQSRTVGGSKTVTQGLPSAFDRLSADHLTEDGYLLGCSAV